MFDRLAVIAVLTVCMLGTSAAAQDERFDKKNEVTGIIGRIFISDQGIQGANYFNPYVRSGKGLTFEINYSRLFFGTPVFSLSGEIPAAFNLREKLNSGSDVVPPNYKQIFVTPSARLNLFPATKVSPWVSLGGGFGYFNENKNLLYYGPNPGGSSTTGVLQIGVGLDLQVWSRFSIRGQLRDFWSGTPDLPLADTGKTRQNNLFLGAGLVYHF